MVAVGADPANARFVRKQPAVPGAFAVAPYYEMALATDHPHARLFWLSWKNWMLFLRMMRVMLEILYQDEWLVAVNKPSGGWFTAAGWIATRK